MDIIVDTNFLLIPSQFKVDIFSEIERIMEEQYTIYVFDRTIDELHKIIQEQPGKHKQAAKLALDLLKAHNVQVLETETHLNVDHLIVKHARAQKCIVATQDAALKAKLKEYNVRIIVLRSKKHLQLI